MMANGRVLQINVSDGGVPKHRVEWAQATTLGLSGDRQEHTDVHGGPERAVCLYSLERISALQAEGHPIQPGSAGENLTLSGLDWEQIIPGVRLQVGAGVLLEVTRYTTPCTEIVASFVDGYSNRIHQRKYPGWSRVYARVLQEGEIQVGDEVIICQLA